MQLSTVLAVARLRSSHRITTMRDYVRVGWLMVFAVVAGLWLWSQRYEYVGCDADGYCAVANRYTGHIGLVLTPLKQGQLYEKFPRAKVDSILQLMHP